MAALTGSPIAEGIFTWPAYDPQLISGRCADAVAIVGVGLHPLIGRATRSHGSCEDRPPNARSLELPPSATRMSTASGTPGVAILRR
jgi:hypothetical protein